MYKPSIYLVVTYFSTYLLIYRTYSHKMDHLDLKAYINSVEVHPQLSHRGIQWMVHWLQLFTLAVKEPFLYIASLTLKSVNLLPNIFGLLKILIRNLVHSISFCKFSFPSYTFDALLCWN